MSISKLHCQRIMEIIVEYLWTFHLHINSGYSQCFLQDWTWWCLGFYGDVHLVEQKGSMCCGRNTGYSQVHLGRLQQAPCRQAVPSCELCYWKSAPWHAWCLWRFTSAHFSSSIPFPSLMTDHQAKALLNSQLFSSLSPCEFDMEAARDWC